MSGYKRYPKYRSSGVEWIEEVPEGWEINRLRFVAPFYNSNVDKKTYEGQKPIHLCNYTDVYNNEFITPGMPFMPSTATASEIQQFTLEQGDVLITKDSESPDDIGIPSFVVQNLPGIVCGYHLTMVRAKSVETARYLHRSIQSHLAKAHFFVEAPGLTRYGLSQDAIGNTPICLPPPAEQSAIATYLDRSTTRIDALVAKKTRFIALLKEKRQALITHAVTKGLNPNAKMKDSGVEWIGEVPEGWKIRPIKSLAKGPGSKFIDGDWIESKNLANEGLRYITTGNVGEGIYKAQGSGFISEATFHELGCTEVLPGDILISRLNPPIGRACIVPELGFRIVTSVDNVIFRPDAAFDRRFLVYRFSAADYLHELSVRGSGATMQRVGRSELGHVRIALPPPSEQTAIAAHLDRATARIDKLVSLTDHSIALLQEKRSALITAAVTGQIDVREEVSVEAPEEIAA